MGNTRSQSYRRSKQFYLFYFIHRTWSAVIEHQRTQDPSDDIDRETDLSSNCSSCNNVYRQDSLILDSESDMAPNAEEELLAVKAWGRQPEKERLRPPTYNAEDYAIALRRWGKRPLGTIQDSQGTLPSTTSSSSGYASGSGEMTLRQFTSVSELLNKLRADLRLAFPSFVQEFSSLPADGITLLLETLRGVQLAQSLPPTSGQTGPRIGIRRAALDELGCVECLAACAERCADASRLLVQAHPGLLALTVCLTSSLNRSRVLALQLLTKVCQAPGGHAAVSEAVSTLRLKYGEGGRFRFLAGALLAPRAATALRVAGLSFLNAFLRSAPRTQTKLYIQAEACEAGLEPQILQEWLREFDGREEDALTDLLLKEVQKWTHNCVDVDALQRRVMRAEETCKILTRKVSLLQTQLEKRNDYNLEEQDKSVSTILTATKSLKVSSNAEDEGISSSERSISPENIKRQAAINHQKGSPTQSHDQETTIDDVIEELRIIVKDAEEEFSDNIHDIKQQSNIEETVCNQESVKDTYRSSSKISLINPENYMYDRVFKRDEEMTLKNTNTNSNISQCQRKDEQITYFGNDQDYNTMSTSRLNLPCRMSKSSTEGSVKIVVKGPEVEEEIIPAIVHPQPPRRIPPCLSSILAIRHYDFTDHVETYNSHDEEIEEETLGDGSDSLLSASRLKYNSKHQVYERPIKSVNMDQLQKQMKNDTAVISSDQTDVKFKKNSDDFCYSDENHSKANKTMKNYEISNEFKSSRITDVKSKDENIDVCRQFESTPKGFNVSSAQFVDCTPTNPRTPHNSKYKNDMEKRRYLRRSVSHDYLESNVSSPRLRRSENRVECRIRKFESLNSFDDHRNLQNYVRLNSSENLNKREQTVLLTDTSKFHMRRSESFHHISQVTKKDHCSLKGKSDSGFFYITDFNLEPLVTRRSIDVPKSPNLLTKSLDRIDEGLDSIVNIVITEERNQWNEDKHLQLKLNKSQGEKQLTKSKSVINGDDFGVNSSEFNKQIIRENSIYKNKFLKNDELYNINDNQLRNDEFYEEERFREWNYHNELNYERSKDKINPENSSVILTKTGVRHNSFRQKGNIGNKLSCKSNESGVFIGQTYDTFGLGKSRFNAGKYSSSTQRAKGNSINRRNTTSSIEKRGKVTDVVSGLY